MKWTDEEVSFLMNNYMNYTANELAETLNKTVAAIRKKSYRLGIEIKTTNDNWTEEEINILREYSSKYYYRELTKVLPGRSIKSISSKAYSLNIPLIVAHTNLSEEEKQFIIDNNYKLTNAELCNHLCISYPILHRYQKELGLSPKEKEVKWTSKVIENIKKDLKKMNRKSIAKKYNTSVRVINNLVSKYKLSESKNNWTDKELKKLREYVESGLSLKEISELMKRPYTSVAIKSSEFREHTQKNHMTEEDILLIKKYAYKLTSKEIAERLNMNEQYIYNKAFNLGIKLKRENEKNVWTQEKIDKLIKLHDRVCIQDLVYELGFTMSAIRKKAKELGVSTFNKEKMPWYPEEEVKLRKLCVECTAKELAKIFDRSEGAIRAKLDKLGLKAKTSDYFWTPEEEKQLLDIYQDYTIYELSNIMNKPYGAISLKLQKLNLRYDERNVRKWTPEEEEKLIELIETKSIINISKILNRSVMSIRVKLLNLKLDYKRDMERWSCEDEKFLQDNWGYYSIEYFMRKLKRSEQSIRYKATELKLGSQILANDRVMTIVELMEIFDLNRINLLSWIGLGLPVKEKKISNYKKYQYVEFDELLRFLEKHQDIWDSRLLDEYYLGIEPEWLKEKRQRDSLSNETIRLDDFNLEKLKSLKTFIEEKNVKKKKK